MDTLLLISFIDTEENIFLWNKVAFAIYHCVAETESIAFWLNECNISNEFLKELKHMALSFIKC